MPYDPADEEWSAMVAAHVAAGRTLQRVHVIVEPLTPYVQYEVAWGYQPSLGAGEDIRVIPCEQGTWPDGLPTGHDYWLLDDQLWVMTYDDAGRPLYADNVTDPDEVAQHLAWRDRALELSTPVGEFIASSSQLRERVPA